MTIVSRLNIFSVGGQPRRQQRKSDTEDPTHRSGGFSERVSQLVPSIQSGFPADAAAAKWSCQGDVMLRVRTAPVILG